MCTECPRWLADDLDAAFPRFLAHHQRWGRFRRATLVSIAWLGPSMLWMWDLTPPGYLVAVTAYSAFFGLGAALAPGGRGRPLGLVGALSIVRFRTPIKEPEELAYLFVTVMIGIGLDQETNERYTQGILDVQKTTRKPFIMVGIPGFGEDIISRFCNAGVPFFDSAERAMQTYARVCRYQDWRCRVGAYAKSDADHLSVVQ